MCSSGTEAIWPACWDFWRKRVNQGKIMELLSKVVPGIQHIEIKHIGKKETLEFRQLVGTNKDPWRFMAENMSDGTLRALGILTALFQSAKTGGKRVPLVGIEEPETAVHPGAAGVLRDGLKAASVTTQTVVTSHSPDLLDDKGITDENILAVVNRNGETRIGHMNQAEKKIRPGASLHRWRTVADGSSGTGRRRNRQDSCISIRAFLGMQIMTTACIAAIVEGHGESDSIPILIRRIALDIDPGFVPKVLKPLRSSASKLVKDGELEKAVLLAASKLQGRGGILVILDCDDGCPAKEGPALLQRVRQARSDMPIAVVLAKKEYEAWFLAAAESIGGKRGLPTNLSSPPRPEDIRDAKGWLSDKMPKGTSYVETTDQAALTACFDMAIARRQADSFDKCYREIYGMLSSLWTV